MQASSSSSSSCIVQHDTGFVERFKEQGCHQAAAARPTWYWRRLMTGQGNSSRCGRIRLRNESPELACALELVPARPPELTFVLFVWSDCRECWLAGCGRAWRRPSLMQLDRCQLATRGLGDPVGLSQRGARLGAAPIESHSAAAGQGSLANSSLYGAASIAFIVRSSVPAGRHSAAKVTLQLTRLPDTKPLASTSQLASLRPR